MESYFKNVPLGIDNLSSNGSITKFLSLEATFGAGSKDSYDPWLGIDFFGRAGILTCLDPNEPSSSAQKESSVSEAPKSSGQEKNLAVPPGTKRSFKLLSTSDLTRSSD